MTAPTLPLVLNPEEALLGALLFADIGQARELLALVADEDVTDPDRRQVFEAVRVLVDTGTAPQPGIVLRHVTRTLGKVAGHRLGLVIAAAYASAPTPSMGEHFAAALAEETARRQARRVAARLEQAADAPLSTLLDVWREAVDAYTAAVGRVTG